MVTELRVELTGWDAMVYICPELRSIVEDAAHTVSEGHDYAVTYDDGKRSSRFLVGWEAADERLSGPECYDIFIRKLAEAVGL